MGDYSIMIIWLIIIILILIILSRFYTIKEETIIGLTGGLGTGKTLIGVEKAISLLKKARFKWWIDNHIFLWKKKREKPLLYSNIPIRISKKEWATELTEQHLLLQEKIIEKSIVFMDEIGAYASQWDYNNPNAKETFDEFIRLFRHYTKGGYLIATEQCSENIILTVRRRINTVNNLLHFKKFLGIFYLVKVRKISISEEIKTIEQQNAEDNMRTKFGLLLGKRKMYDTYCYSERYKTVPTGQNNLYNDYKKFTLMKISKKLVQPKTTNEKI